MRGARIGAVVCGVAVGLVLGCLIPGAFAEAPRGPSPAQAIGEGEADFHFTSLSPLESDRDRYVAYVPRGSSDMAVYDTAGGATFTVSGCRPASGAPGVFLVGCGLGCCADRILNVRTRQVSPIPGAKPGDTFIDIGRYWAVGEAASDCNGSLKCGTTKLTLNWRTGQRHTCYERAEGGDTCTYYDLDSARRRPMPGLWGDHEPGYDWELPKEGLILEHHWHRVARLAPLTACEADFCQPELYAHWLSWTELRPGAAVSYVGAYSIRTHSRLRWRVGGPCHTGDDSHGTAPGVGQVHTRYGIAMRVLSSDTADCNTNPYYSLWFARWPHRH